MGYLLPDAYYDPEKFGLTIVAMIEWNDWAYEFNMTGIWMDGHGQLYLADDSGCSCPTPFEWVTSLDKLDKLSKFEVAKHLNDRVQLCKPDRYSTQANYERVQVEAVDALTKIMRL